MICATKKKEHKTILIILLIICSLLRWDVLYFSKILKLLIQSIIFILSDWDSRWRILQRSLPFTHGKHELHAQRIKADLSSDKKQSALLSSVFMVLIGLEWVISGLGWPTWPSPPQTYYILKPAHLVNWSEKDLFGLSVSSFGKSVTTL